MPDPPPDLPDPRPSSAAPLPAPMAVGEPPIGGVTYTASGAAPPVDYREQPPQQMGRASSGDVAVCFAVAAILVIFSPNAWLFILNKLGVGEGPGVVTDVNTGVTIPYLESIFFIGDLGVALYAVALVVEGLVLWLSRCKWIPLGTTVLMALVAIYNVVAVVWNQTHHVSMFYNALVAVFALYAGWQIFQLYRQRATVPMARRLTPAQ